jgi:hypothetical protein
VIGAGVGSGAGIGAATGAFTAGAGGATGAGGGGVTGMGAGIGAATGALVTVAGVGVAIGCGPGSGAGATADGFTLVPRLLRDLTFDGWPVSGNWAGAETADSGRTKGCAGTSDRFSTGTARSTTVGATGTGAGAAGADAGAELCRPRNASRFTSTLGGVAVACASAGAAPSPHAILHTLASSAARRAVTGEKRRFAIA